MVDTVKTPYSSTTIFSAALFSLLLFCTGYFIGIQSKDFCEFSPNLKENLQLDSNVSNLKVHGEDIFGNMDNLQSKALKFTSKEFSCNFLGALEYLAQLHTGRMALEKHSKRGEANRIRVANLERKLGQARSAESAMRKCVKITVPELLAYWDESLKKNPNLGKRWITEREEVLNSGITIQELEKMAEELDYSNK